MKFSLQNTRVYQDFDNLKIGEIFLDRNDCPYIRMREVQVRFIHNVYNCIRLSDVNSVFFFLMKEYISPLITLLRLTFKGLGKSPFHALDVLRLTPQRVCHLT